MTTGRVASLPGLCEARVIFGCEVFAGGPPALLLAPYRRWLILRPPDLGICQSPTLVVHPRLLRSVFPGGPPAEYLPLTADYPDLPRRSPSPIPSADIHCWSSLMRGPGGGLGSPHAVAAFVLLALTMFRIETSRGSTAPTGGPRRHRASPKNRRSVARPFAVLLCTSSVAASRGSCAPAWGPLSLLTSEAASLPQVCSGLDWSAAGREAIPYSVLSLSLPLIQG